MKRLVVIVSLAAACSSSPAAPAADSGAATDSGTAPAGSACESICAGGTCAASCVADCQGAVGAVAACSSQFTAVVRCLAAAGTRCTPMASATGPCASQSAAYTTCASGGGETDAGTAPDDTGSTATQDTGSTATPDTGVASPEIAGRWTFSTAAPQFDYELDFMGGPTSGVINYRSVLTLPSSGCVTTNEYSGRWSLSGATLSVTFTSGTAAVTMCNDSSANRPESPVSDADLESNAMRYRGVVTVDGNSLTFTMFDGTRMRTFTRP